MFQFKSDLILSKSWLNRALVINFYQQNINNNLISDSDDVIFLKNTINLIKTQRVFNLGLGGTSFRFFCFLISKLEGEWEVRAHEKLLRRPQEGLIQILTQLGVQCDMQSEKLVIKSKGWIIPHQLKIQAKDSSQFISGLVLNSWNLPNDLHLEIQKPIASEDYFKLTLDLLKSSGLQFTLNEDLKSFHICIFKNQKPNEIQLVPEVDVSSAFSIAAAAVLNGQIEITNWNPNSKQPDMKFLKIFDLMNIQYMQQNRSLSISKQAQFNSVDFDLNNCPDLFPVLSVLCAFAQGKSTLSGAAHLQHKESNRLLKTKELLDLVGVESELKTDGLVIQGQSFKAEKTKKIFFNPDHDHRMAMAAGLLKLMGFQVLIETPEVVQKSFPDFFELIGVTP